MSDSVCVSKKILPLVGLLSMLTVVVFVAIYLLTTSPKLQTRAAPLQNQVGGLHQPCDRGICSSGLVCYHKPSYFDKEINPDAWLETECDYVHEARGKELYECNTNNTCGVGLVCRTVENFAVYPRELFKDDSTEVSLYYANTQLNAIDIGRYIKNNMLFGSRAFAIRDDYSYAEIAANALERMKQVGIKPKTLCIKPNGSDDITNYLSSSGNAGYMPLPDGSCMLGNWPQGMYGGCPLYGGISASAQTILDASLNSSVRSFPTITYKRNDNTVIPIRFRVEQRCYSIDALKQAVRAVFHESSGVTKECADEFPPKTPPIPITTVTPLPKTYHSECGGQNQSCCDNVYSTQACDDMSINSCAQYGSGTVCNSSSAVMAHSDFITSATLQMQVDDYYQSGNVIRPVPVFKNGEAINYAADKTEYGYPIIVEPDKKNMNMILQHSTIQIRHEEWSNVPLRGILGSQYVGFLARISTRNVHNAKIITDPFIRDQYGQAPTITATIDCGDGVNTNVKVGARFEYNRSLSESGSISDIMLLLGGYDPLGKMISSFACDWTWGKDYELTVKKLQFAKDYLGEYKQEQVTYDNINIKGKSKFVKTTIQTNKR